RRLTLSDDPNSERRNAITRLLDYYIHSAALGMDQLYPQERHRRPQDIPSAQTLRGNSRTDPRAWLQAELPNIVVIARYAATNGWPKYAVWFATTLRRHLDTLGYYKDSLDLHEHALQAAIQEGDRMGAAEVSNNLGTVYWQMGRYQEAIDRL